MQNCLKVFAQAFFHLPFSTYRVLVEEASIAAHVERKVFTPFGQQNRWLSERVRITQLVKDILVLFGYLCDYDLGFVNVMNDIIQNDSWAENFSRVMSFESKILCNWLDHVLIEFVIRLGELHYHEDPTGLLADRDICEFDGLIPPSE